MGGQFLMSEVPLYWFTMWEDSCNVPRASSSEYLVQILHFEPSLDALSLRSDVISSIKILSTDQPKPDPTGRLDA